MNLPSIKISILPADGINDAQLLSSDHTGMILDVHGNAGLEHQKQPSVSETLWRGIENAVKYLQVIFMTSGNSSTRQKRQAGDQMLHSGWHSHT